MEDQAGRRRGFLTRKYPQQSSLLMRTTDSLAARLPRPVKMKARADRAQFSRVMMAVRHGNRTITFPSRSIAFSSSIGLTDGPLVRMESSIELRTADVPGRLCGA